MSIPSSDRFEIRMRLGEGGMGVVYAAFDRERKELVALKALRGIDAAGLYRLKTEFRALSGIFHPNVIRLHELFFLDQSAFFTMELVSGQDFASYVRSGGASPSSRSEAETRPRSLTARTLLGSVNATLSATAVSVRRRDAGVAPLFDDVRLRGALRQLAAGIASIHRAGKLHRDLKPSNVMVTPEGRVVVLDFGLAEQNEPQQPLDAGEQTPASLVLGTPGYMSPEQARGASASPASDWYAFGVMLYAALAGTLPFVGSIAQVLEDKQNQDPVAPESWGAHVPSDLSRLCMQLLARDAAARPTDLEVLRALGVEDESSGPANASGLFVGRDEQLNKLFELLAQTRDGKPSLVFVQSGGGMGKTRLISEFERRARTRMQAWSVQGRAYEQENIPFRAFDTIVDALSAKLDTLDGNAVQALLPRGVASLVDLFPVLSRVSALCEAPSLYEPPLKPELRRQAGFVAFKELLSRVADRTPLMLHFDEAQWGDSDSASLLEFLLAEPNPTPCLVVLSYNSEATSAGHFVQQVRKHVENGSGIRHETLTLRPLSLEESRELAHSLLQHESEHDIASSATDAGDDNGAAADTEGLVLRIAALSHGDPLMIAELARYAHAFDPLLPSIVPAVLEFRNFVTWRLTRLAPNERRLVDLLSVAGAPVFAELALQYAKIPSAEAAATLAALEQDRWLIRRIRGGVDSLEPLHLRLAAETRAELGVAARQALHQTLAEILLKQQAAGKDSSGLDEAIFRHLTAAGDIVTAVPHLERAARAAEERLAFARASELFQQAIELETRPLQRVRLLIADAAVLVKLGRNREGAQQLLSAAELAPVADARALTRQAIDLGLGPSMVGHSLRQGEGGSKLLFADLPATVLEQLIESSAVRWLNPGEQLPEVDLAAASIIAVLSGSLLMALKESETRFLPGELLGEIGFLLAQPRRGQLRAGETGARILELSRQAFDDLAQRTPELGQKLALNLAKAVSRKLLSLSTHLGEL